MTKRVVITGLGAVTPIGSGKAEFWQALLDGKSGAAQVTRFDTSEYVRHRACEVKNFDFTPYAKPENRPIGKGSQLAIVAAEQAIADANLKLDSVDPYRIGVSVGTTAGEIQILEDANVVRHRDGVDAIDPNIFRQHPVNNIPSNVGIHLGLKGPNMIIPTACAAGNYAIGYACDLIRLGRVDYMLAGGSDPFSKVAFTGFCRLGAVAPDICQPFDKNRKGMMVGEGAGIILLESLDSAIARGVEPYAEVIGYGLSCDGHHMTTPHPDGIGVISAMKKALQDAGITPEDVQYISAHGTGTPANDKAEVTAVKTVMGDHAKTVMISSIKSMIGHTMGAASALEAIACALAVKHNLVPPTINFEEADPECDIDCVPNKAREAQVNIALNNAYAFGGNNSCLVIRKL
jgi:3-oxoacyl-[acyl-carrier-protein] synthase II